MGLNDSRHWPFLVVGTVVLAGTGALAATTPGAEQRVEASDTAGLDHFGRAVDIWGDIAVVGDPGDDEEAQDAGAAYVFRRVGGSWTETDKLTMGKDAGDHYECGFDVAVERDLIAMGCPGDDDNPAMSSNEAGSVLLFEWDGDSWEESEKFLNPDATPNSTGFGKAVDIGIWVPEDAIEAELTYIAIGAPGEDSAQGVVYLYRLNGALWTPAGTLSDSDSTGVFDAGEFGSSVAIFDDNLVAGAPLDDRSGGSQFMSNSGAAYLFGRGQIVHTWSEVLPLYPSDPNPGDQFGYSVALSEGIVVVGAHAPSGGNPGRAFVYDGNCDTAVFTAGSNVAEFGSAVAVDEQNEVIVIGSKRDDETADRAGAFYVLQRAAQCDWQDAGKVLASDSAIDKELGESVALHDGFLVVGSGADPSFTVAGAAYFYPPVLFADGFESGSTSAWSLSVP